MLRLNRFKKKPPIEISDNKSIFTFSTPSSSLGLFRTGEKRGYPPSSIKKENQKPVKKTTKLVTFTASMPSIPFPSLSLKQYL